MEFSTVSYLVSYFVVLIMRRGFHPAIWQTPSTLAYSYNSFKSDSLHDRKVRRSVVGTTPVTSTCLFMYIPQLFVCPYLYRLVILN